MTVENNVSSDQVFALAEQQLSNGGSQPQADNENSGQEGRVPYDRFKEVNDERKQLADQNSKLLEQVMQFQQMQAQVQQQTQNNSVEQQAPNIPVNQPLFTEAELEQYEQDLVLNPKEALQKYGEAILNRGVESRVKSLEQTFEQKLNQLNSQMVAQTIPSVINNFKQTRFSPNEQAEMQAFDQAVQSMDPAMLMQPGTLDNIRLAAIGYVADQRRNQPQNNTNQYFSESPTTGGLPSGWGGLGTNPQAPQVPQQVLTAAQKMGVSAEEAAAFYTAMDRSGVFR